LPVVTVIVPGRDVAPYAVQALDSLKAQTLAAWRAILVDDGSTDATTAIFRAAAADDARFSVIRNDAPQGLGAARNAALDLVDTPFVAFLDADDELTPTALERLVGTITETGSDLVVGAYVRLRPSDDGGYVPGVVQPWVAASTAPARRGTTLAEHPEVSGNIVAWSKVSRIEFWRRHGIRFPEGKMYEDQLVAQRMYTLARAIDVIPDVVILWRERAEGTSITQHKDALPVLVDYLEALRGGIAVLDAASQREAARSRVRLILDMDVPPLVAIAQGHPDDAYRRVLGELVRELVARAETERIPLDAASAALREAARLW
jgi:glycosyltransferase involved in cell wall biosynthesis